MLVATTCLPGIRHLRELSAFIQLMRPCCLQCCLLHRLPRRDYPVHVSIYTSTPYSNVCAYPTSSRGNSPFLIHEYFACKFPLSSTSGALLPPKCPSGPPSSLSPSRANKKCLNGIFIRAPSLSRSLLPLKSQLSNGSFQFFPKGPTNIRRHENFTDGSFVTVPRDC